MPLSEPSIRVLGPVEVVGADGAVGLGDRQRLLLAVLVAHRNRPVLTDVLMDAAWPDGGDRTSALHTQVSRLRRLLADARVPVSIETRPGAYALVVADDQVDAELFEARCREARDEPDPAERAAVLRDALALWRGPAFGTVADVDAIQPEAVRLDEMRATAIEERGAMLVEAGRPEDAIAELEVFVRAHPLREEASGSLMRALYACGRQADALRHYQHHREHLAEQLGIEPSAGLQRLELEILQQAVDVPGRPVGPSPAALDALELSYLHRGDGVAIASATLGTGPPMLAVPAWVTSLEVISAGRDPRSSLLERLAHHVTLTLYDRFGTGLSPGQVDDFSLAGTVAELLDVLDHTGPAALLAVSQAGPAAVAAAVERPDLVTHLILFGTFASARDAFPDERTVRASLELMRANWGLGSRLLAGLYRPGATDEVTGHLARVMRESASEEVAVGYLEEMFRTDVSSLLPEVRCPSLVLHYSGDKVIPFAGGRQLASGLPGAVFVPLDGGFHLPDARDLDRIVSTIVDFVRVTPA